jgi:hypothetical protein
MDAAVRQFIQRQTTETLNPETIHDLMTMLPPDAIVGCSDPKLEFEVWFLLLGLIAVPVAASFVFRVNGIAR